MIRPLPDPVPLDEFLNNLDAQHDRIDAYLDARDSEGFCARSLSLIEPVNTEKENA